VTISGPPGRRYRWEPITIAQQLERTADAHGKNEALIATDRRLTWAQTRDEARAFAKALLSAGIEPGDHLAVWLPNQIEWVLAWFGSAYVGAVVVPINSRYKKEEAGYILAQSDSKLLFVREPFLGMDYRGMLDALVPMVDGRPDRSGLPALREIVALGAGAPPQATPFAEFLAAGRQTGDDELDRRAAAGGYEDPTIIVYTSGTTGHPKGAVHSHLILRNECSIAEWLDIGPDSRILGHMPFFHVAGGFSAILPALISGGALVLMDHWDVAAALSAIERERVSSFSGIPTHFIDVLNHPDLSRHDVSSLYSGWMGGASTPREVIDGVLTRLGMTRLLPVYGMTETTSVTTFPRPDDPREIVLAGKGVPVSDFEVKIAGLDGGRELEADVEGEICVRGHCVM
jgi:fatty-acyl-CoA synthase